MGFSNRRFGYGAATFGYGGGRISRSFMDGITARNSLLGLWSTARRAWSGYSGAILRARRSSDNAEKDFYPNGPQGEVSTSDVRAWNGWNLLRHTEAFDNVYWTKGDASVTAATPPSGYSQAWKLGETATSALHYIGRGMSDVYTASTQYTLSVVAKAAERTAISLVAESNGDLRCDFNLSTGTFQNIGVGANGAIQSLGDGWYRCSMRFTAADTAGATTYLAILQAVNGSLVYSGSLGSGVLITGFQLERASSFSTYEPRTTTGAGDSFLVTLYEQAENGRNLLARTEEFDTGWSDSTAGLGVAPVVTANAGLSPIGDSTADRLQFSLGGGTSGGDRSRRIQATTTGANTYTYSIYLKSTDGTSTYNMHLLDASNETRSIVVTGSWQRFTVTATSVGNPTIGFGLRGGQTPVNPNTADVLAWGAQLEVGTTATTYERRTTHGAGTRLNFTQSTTTLQPIICEQGVPVTESGRLAAKFVAADARRMSIPSSTAMFNALHTTGGTMLCVNRCNDTAVFKTLLANKPGANDAGLLMGRGSNESTQFYTGRTDVAGVATNGGTVAIVSNGTSTSLSVLAAILDPDNATAASRSTIWLNGTQDAAVNAASATPFVENANANMTLGSNTAVSTPFDGTISEVALFSSLISTADRVTLEDRAGDFYGVAVTQPITITTQPTSKLVTFGEAFTLTCEGTNVQTYNWQFRNAGDTAWSAVGVQTSTLNLVGEAAMNGREYRCVLINPNASATSNTATITAQGIMAKVGTFNSPTSTGAQAVTGVGFQPKAIIPFGPTSQTDGAATGYALAFGAGVSSSARAAISADSQNGVTTSRTARLHSNTQVFSNLNAGSSPSVFLSADLTSLDSDGFSLNWSAAHTTSRIINNISLGGSTLEANLVQCQMNTTGVAESFAHGLSGPPTAIIVFAATSIIAPPFNGAPMHLSYGAWTPEEQFVAAAFSANGMTTTQTRRYFATGRVCARVTTLIQRSMSISSVNATNVNVTYPEFSVSENYFWMLCLRGCKAQVGAFDVNGSLDPFSISCPDITPRLFLTIMIPEGVDQLGSIRSGVFYAIGASDGVTNVSCGITDLSSVTTTNTRRYQSSTALVEYNDAGTLQSQAVATFSGNSVVYDASTINSVYGQGGYLIIGE